MAPAEPQVPAWRGVHLPRQSLRCRRGAGCVPPLWQAEAPARRKELAEAEMFCAGVDDAETEAAALGIARAHVAAVSGRGRVVQPPQQRDRPA